MPSRKEIDRRVKRELLLALKVERRSSLLYKQKLDELVSLYTDLMTPYFRNGKFDSISYMRDKTYSKEFRKKLIQLESKIGEFAVAAGNDVTKGLTASLGISYERVMKDIFNDSKLVVPLELRTPDKVAAAVARNFADNKHFSERIWRSTRDMEKKLRASLDISILQGRPINETAKEFAQVTGNSYYNARRVIRTETIATYSKASLDGYAALGVEKVEVLESQADSKDICASHDGDIVRISEAVIGQNIPPFHPHCRGTITPVFSD